MPSCAASLALLALHSALGSSLLTGVAAHPFLGDLLERTRRRAVERQQLEQAQLQQQQDASLCSLRWSDLRPNFFLFWSGAAEEFGQRAFSTLETVLYQHPDANVVVLSTGLAPDMFDAYLREGYCVATSNLEFGQIVSLLNAASPNAPAQGFVSAQEWVHDESVFNFLLNCLAMALQVLFGGVSLLMDGLLLNPFDFMLPAELSLHDTAIFLERVVSPEQPPPPWAALQGDDFDQSWLPRSFADRSDGFTLLCMEMMCPRALPAGTSLGRGLLEAWLQQYMEQPQGGRSVPELSELGTGMYRLYLRERPKRAPLEIDGFTFNHEIVALPFWSLTDAHAQDGWKAFGGMSDALSEHSQLYSPRAGKESFDWHLLSTSKLWLPLGYGPRHARNIMPRSFADIALRFLTLGISSKAYRPKQFGPPLPRKGPWPPTLRSPRDPQLLFLGVDGMTAKPEAALPGDMGGFRTLRHIRIVGSSDATPSTLAGQISTAAGAPTLRTWRLRVSSANTDLRFFCRHAPRARTAAPASTGSFGSNAGSDAHRRCKEALRQPAVEAHPTSLSDEKPKLLFFELLGSAAVINAAVGLLAYRPRHGLPTREIKMQATDSQPQAETDPRLTMDELLSHFAEVHVDIEQLGQGLQQPANSAHHTALLALLDDVQDYVSVVAHSAERCELLDRLALSFRSVYAQMKIIVTCECSEEQQCSEGAKPHDTIPGMTVINVPYDFGLSRGKSLLVSQVETEFVLVLDDDFVHSYHSCLECMLWRMRSPQHSLWRPFDILGFPVQEDERNFGAFRGQLRVIQNQLYLEPLVSMVLPDGVVRVDICPMVFLARTARFRLFEFQADLQVGEHEQFFYLNAHKGMQVAVSSDSSFPHFRVQTLSPGYVKRRERMPALMAASFGKLGFQRAMYMFRKYDHGSMADYDELLGKFTPPWYVSDDTCGPRPSPPVPFAQVFVVVLSSSDSAGAKYRDVLRGLSAGTRNWLQELQDMAPSQARVMFATAINEITPSLSALSEEQRRHGDMLLIPHGHRTPSGASFLAEASIETLLHIFAALRDFQFRWLVVLCEDVFVSFPRLMAALAEHDNPPFRAVLGSFSSSSSSFTSTPSASSSPAPAASRSWLDPRFFAMSRDVFHLLSSPELMPLLGGSAFEQQQQPQQKSRQSESPHSLAGGLNALLCMFSVRRLHLPGMYLGRTRGSAFSSSSQPKLPEDALAVHSATPEQLHFWSMGSFAQHS